jgi:two-component system cell cycle sensor histidine kinase/response regulator CckA
MDRTAWQAGPPGFARAPEGALRPRTGAPRSQSRRACVLVAEDEDLLRELAIEVLDANGFDAIGARHGGEALSLFCAHAEQIDAVLLDLSMPVLDGAHVLGEMRKQKPSVRVMLTSGYERGDTGVPDTDGPIRFLQKPYRADKLVAQLKALLDC